MVGSLSAFYHDSIDIHDPKQRELAAHPPDRQDADHRRRRLPHNRSAGRCVYPRTTSSYGANFLHMMFAVPCEPYERSPVAAKALDLLFILHADHEQNASTSHRAPGRPHGANPYACVAAGIAALWGPAHGGANEAVLRHARGDRRRPEHRKYVDKAKDKDDPFRLMGFGHRVYKNYDPRATIIREMCHKVLRELAA